MATDDDEDDDGDDVDDDCTTVVADMIIAGITPDTSDTTPDTPDMTPDTHDMTHDTPDTSDMTQPNHGNYEDYHRHDNGFRGRLRGENPFCLADYFLPQSLLL